MSPWANVCVFILPTTFPILSYAVTILSCCFTNTSGVFINENVTKTPINEKLEVFINYNYNKNEKENPLPDATVYV